MLHTVEFPMPSTDGKLQVASRNNFQTVETFSRVRHTSYDWFMNGALLKFRSSHNSGDIWGIEANGKSGE